MFSQKTKAPARNTDPNTTECFRSCLSQKTKALARNADTEHHGFPGHVFLIKTRAPARNAHTEHHGFFRSCFTSKQEPLLGTPTRSTTAFQVMFFLENKSPREER